MKNFVASCCYPVADGMKVHTNTRELRQARRDIVELLVDNHPEDCHTCERDGNCELQRLVYSMGIRHRHFTGERKHYEKDLSGASVIRDPDKCIPLRTLRSNVLGDPGRPLPDPGPSRLQHGRSCRRTTCRLRKPFAAVAASASMSCPTAAFVEKNYTQELFEKLNDKDLITVGAVRAVGAGGHRRGLRPACRTEHGRTAHRSAAEARNRLRF